MRIRIAAVAVTVGAAATIAALGTPALSQASGEGRQPDGGDTAPTLREAARSAALVGACTGGAQKRAFSGGTSDWFGTSSQDLLPGASYQFRGPKKGKDTVFVDVTAFETYADSMGRMRVLLDGVDLAPTNTAPEWFASSDNYSATAGQYCAKVGRGGHRVKVVLESNGTGSAYVYNGMLHVEVAE